MQQPHCQLIAKDITDPKVTENVNTVLKEFKQVEFEKRIIAKGGHSIKIPCETRWCTYRDSYLNLVKNLPFMKSIAAENKEKKLKQNVINLIFYDDFVEIVKENIKIFDPVCHLINSCQESVFSIADAANL